jgi:hypothetical protein
MRRSSSAGRETGDAELLRVGKTSIVWQSRASAAQSSREGVETRRGSNLSTDLSGENEGIVLTANRDAKFW